MSEVRPHEVKHILHKEVFHPNGERLIGFTMVSKTEPGLLSKANTHYLCTSVTIKRPVRAYISRYRKNDHGDGYEQRRKWPIEDLKKVDGHSTVSACLLFDLVFDRAFKFQSSTAHDKEEFLESVATLCSKHLDSPSPPFMNVTSKVQSALPTAAADTKRQMEKNKQLLAERGQKLSHVEDATAEMAQSAENFSRNAKKLSEQYRN